MLLTHKECTVAREMRHTHTHTHTHTPLDHGVRAGLAGRAGGSTGTRSVAASRPGPSVGDSRGPARKPRACLEESDNELRELGYGIPERKKKQRNRTPPASCGWVATCLPA